MPFIGAALGAAIGVAASVFALGAYIVRRQERGIAEAKDRLEILLRDLKNMRGTPRNHSQDMN